MSRWTIGKKRASFRRPEAQAKVPITASDGDQLGSTPDNPNAQELGKLRTVDGIEIVSATPQWIVLHVRCDLVTADRLIQFMNEFPDMPQELRQKAGTAFAELLLNAMEHGGHFDPTQYIEMSYIRTSHMVICRIKDPGQGFEAEGIRHAAIANPPDDPGRHIRIRNERGMRPGGYGVLMASRLVDDVVYGAEGNEVLLVKYLKED